MAAFIASPEKPRKRIAKYCKNFAALSISAVAAFYVTQKSEMRFPLFNMESKSPENQYWDLPKILININDKGGALRIVSHVKIDQSIKNDLSERAIEIQDAINKDLLNISLMDASSNLSLEAVRTIIRINVEKISGSGSVEEVLVSEFLQN